MNADSAGQKHGLRESARRLRESSRAGQCACVVGGGFSGLSCAVAFAERGFGVLLIDTVAVGHAPASSAAAGLLDPLTPKGGIMWCGIEAMDATKRLLQAAQGLASRPLFASCGVLHVPASAKQAAALRSAAAECPARPELALLGLSYLEASPIQPGEKVQPLSKMPEGALARPDTCSGFNTCGGSDACSKLERLSCGARCPHGALMCSCGMVVDCAEYLICLWRYVQSITLAECMQTRLSDSRMVSECFDLVVLAAGAGCIGIDETRHLPIDLSRGQLLHYGPLGASSAPAEPQPQTVPPPSQTSELPPPPAPTIAPTTSTTSQAAHSVAAADCRSDLCTASSCSSQEAQQLGSLLSLSVAVTGAVYILPTVPTLSLAAVTSGVASVPYCADGSDGSEGGESGSRRVDRSASWLGGGTHEQTADYTQAQPADLAAAREELEWSLHGLYPPLAAAVSHSVRTACALIPPSRDP